MLSLTRFGLLFGGCIFAGTVAYGAAAGSPNISGTWAGTAKGTEYKDSDNGMGGTTKTMHSAQGTVLATIVQTGNDVSINLAVTTVPNKDNPTPQTLSAQLNGRAGDFAFYASGLFTGPNDSPAQLFLGAQFTSTKIAGNIFIYRNSHVIRLALSLKKTAGAAAVRADALAGLAAESARADSFNLAGSVSGQTFTLTSNAKPATYKSAFTGAFAAGAAALTFVSPTETFNITETNGGDGFVLSGSAGSDNIILFGTGTKTGGSGTGFIYNDTQLRSFKWSGNKL